MSRIFLINVGANSSHSSKARCPIFSDGSFVYVPFPFNSEDDYCWKPYPANAWPFTYNIRWHQTHADPDWTNLTYGDYLGNGRAAALGDAQPDDILLFWSLLWDNTGDCWFDFTGEHAWYLIGAIRVDEILSAGQYATEAKPKNRQRAAFNVHFGQDGSPLWDKNVVFIGNTDHSALFDVAVPLVPKTGFDQRSLLYRTFRTAQGERLPLEGKHWSSYTRSCRAICDLNETDGLKRANILRDAILKQNDIDILAGI